MSDHDKPGDGDIGLQSYFRAAREGVPSPGEALAFRVLEDAKSCQDRFGAAPGTRARGSRLHRLREFAAGWFVAGALAATTCAGFAVGYAGTGLLESVVPVFAADGDATVLDALAVPLAEDIFLGESL